MYTQTTSQNNLESQKTMVTSWKPHIDDCTKKIKNLKTLWQQLGVN